MAPALRIATWAAACLAASISIAQPVARAQIAITEIMYDPVATMGCEYIELFNPTAKAVSLRSWRIADETGKTQGTLPRLASIPAMSYLVIAADTLILRQFPPLRDSSNVVILGRASLGLNSDGDAAILIDRSGTVVDSIRYSPGWHRPDLDETKGTSLERASMTAPPNDPRTWSSSASRSGGTPGASNTVGLPPRVSDAEISVSPITVSPDADGFEDVTRITWRLPASTARVNLTLHDRSGRVISRLVNNEISAPEGETVWDGYDPNGMPLAPGVYVLQLEAYDPNGVGLVSARTGVVVARR